MSHTVKIITGAILSLLLISCGITLPGTGSRETRVKIETTEGEITVKLYNETPLHRDNFLRLVKNKVYDGVIFHRVIDNFMIQGGDPATRLEKGKTETPEYTIPAEIRTPAIYHKKGALAAARLGDAENPLRASSGYQFYIVEGKKFTLEDLSKMQMTKIANYQKVEETAADSLYKFSREALNEYSTNGGTPHLDGNYTVFGEVIKGQEIVDKIAAMATDEKDRPVKEVRIIKMRRLRCIY